jgi:hypothetical protein
MKSGDIKPCFLSYIDCDSASRWLKSVVVWFLNVERFDVELLDLGEVRSWKSRFRGTVCVEGIV